MRKVSPLLILAVCLVMSAWARGADQVRAKWVYDTGQFEHRRGKAWLETDNSGGRLHFREVERNTDYIELYDKSRDISVRLYNKKMYLKQPGENAFKYFRDGKWDD